MFYTKHLIVIHNCCTSINIYIFDNLLVLIKKIKNNKKKNSINKIKQPVTPYIIVVLVLIRQKYILHMLNLFENCKFEVSHLSLVILPKNYFSSLNLKFVILV